jgi:beta-lactamase regulating signal transducer with metallopeptidase domain
MSGILIEIINMSISAGCVTLIVLLIRLLIKKAPKKYTYMLWAIVFFRFIVPFTIQLPVSAVPIAPKPIPQSLAISEHPSIQSGITVIDSAVNSAIGGALATANNTNNIRSLQTVMGISSIIWLAGAIVLLLYAIISYLQLKQKVRTAICASDNIYETDRIKTPLVLGFIHPKIYIPIGLDKQESQYAIQHEKTHIKRCDYLIKPLAFFVVAVHWFNPLVWVAYILMARDMEQSADENVIKQSDIDIRGAYANSLLNLSAKKSGLLNPLAFGNTGVKARISNVLKYRKPALWVSILTIVFVATASVLLMGSAVGNKSDLIPSIVTASQPDSDNTFVVYIDEAYSENEARSLQSQIREIPNVDSVTFISSRQAMDEFVQRVEEHHRLSDVSSSWFRNRYIVYVTDASLIEQTIGYLQDVHGVSVISAGFDMGANKENIIVGYDEYYLNSTTGDTIQVVSGKTALYVY